MSSSSLISIQSFQCPCNTGRGFLPPGDNIYYDMNSAFYNTPNVLEFDQSTYGTMLSSNPKNTTDTTATHSWELQYIPNPSTGVLHVQPSSHHFLLEGASGDSMSSAPSNGPKPELEDFSLTSFAPKSPELAAISTTKTSTLSFLDIKPILLPRISPHVQEAAGSDGRRQWYCTFPHCAHSPFVRRDRAEDHVASIHLNEKRIYCNGSCGNAEW